MRAASLPKPRWAAPDALTERFVHIEHHPAFRSASDWSQAVLDTFGGGAGAAARP